jgi:uncharacterized protein YjbJ (UPF0337 family)
LNQDYFGGKWKQLRGRLRQQWGRLTDDEVDQIAGSRDVMIGKLQERYGRSREEAERELDRWLEEEEKQERLAGVETHRR